MTSAENNIPNVSNLVKKTDFATKVSEIQTKITDHRHDTYITTLKFNKLTAENFASSKFGTRRFSNKDKF